MAVNHRTNKYRVDMSTATYDNSEVDMTKPIQYATRGTNQKIDWVSCTASAGGSTIEAWINGKMERVRINTVKLRNTPPPEVEKKAPDLQFEEGIGGWSSLKIVKK